MSLVRPLSWLAASGFQDGKAWLELAEVGVSGWASVVAIEPAPQEAPGNGCLVLTTVEHIASEVLRLRLAGRGETLKVTPTHPLYVEGRGWTAAGELVPGDLLRSDRGVVGVESVEFAQPNQRVYNIEVGLEHTFRVGESRVWAHNTCDGEAAKGAAGEVRDLATGKGFGPGDAPVRIEGPWTINDLKQGLLGHPPRSLGSPDLHHADQMPGSGIHEVLPGSHRNNPALHPNRFNQGVTPEMRTSDRQLHWWYRAREQGADAVLPGWIYDN